VALRPKPEQTDRYGETPNPAMEFNGREVGPSAAENSPRDLLTPRKEKMAMNSGMIIGEVVANGRPIIGALVGLNHVEIRNRGRLPLYNEREMLSPNLNTKTNSKGVFALCFFWDPLQLGDVADTEAPPFQLNVMRPIGEDYSRATVYQGNLIFVVSLRAIADGRIPDPRKADSVAINTARQAYRYSRGFPLPRLFLSPGRPSPEYYALLGAAQIPV
jgi:hypothetical protein